MRSELRENKLVLFLDGEINSINAVDIEKEINDCIKGQKFDSLELDFENVTYISSAGLRIMLKLKQTYKNLLISNTSLEVYDIFQMTGFTNILTVTKALRKLDISGATLIGEGYFSEVYRINKDTIIKVYRFAKGPEEIENELKLAKQAFVCGIPTAISFDIVKVGDKFGVVFEMLDCASLRNLFRDHPERYDELIDKYVKLLKTINNTEVFGIELVDAKAKYLDRVEQIKKVLTNEEYEQAKKLIKTIPDRNTFIHGDCHVKNIMAQGDELLLIDMDTLAKGHYIFELATIYAPYIAFEEDAPGTTEEFLGIKKELSHKIFYDIVRRYFNKTEDDQEILDKIKIVAYIHMVRWTLKHTPDDTKRLNGCKERLLSLLFKYEDLVI